MEQQQRRNNTVHDDEDEIMDQTNNEADPPVNIYYTDDDEPYVPPEDFLADLSRFSDLSSQEDEEDAYLRTTAEDLNRLDSDDDSLGKDQSFQQTFNRYLLKPEFLRTANKFQSAK